MADPVANRTAAESAPVEIEALNELIAVCLVASGAESAWNQPSGAAGWLE